jgi:hypothetical protein
LSKKKKKKEQIDGKYTTPCKLSSKKQNKICLKDTKMRFLCIAILKGEVHKHGLILDHCVKA